MTSPPDMVFYDHSVEQPSRGVIVSTNFSSTHHNMQLGAELIPQCRGIALKQKLRLDGYVNNLIELVLVIISIVVVEHSSNG